MAGTRLNTIVGIPNDLQPNSLAEFRPIIEEKIAELRERQLQLPSSNADEEIQRALRAAETNLAALNDENFKSATSRITETVNTVITTVNELILKSSLASPPPAPADAQSPAPAGVLGAVPIPNLLAPANQPPAPAEVSGAVPIPNLSAPADAQSPAPAEAPDAMPVPKSSAPTDAQSPAPAGRLPPAPASAASTPVTTPGSLPPPPAISPIQAKTQARRVNDNVSTLPKNAPEWLKRIAADLRAAANEVTNAPDDANVMAAHQKMTEIQNEYDQLTKNDGVQKKIANDVNSIQQVGFDKIENNLALIWGKVGHNQDLVDLSALTNYANKCDQIRQRLESYIAYAEGYVQPAVAAAPNNIQKVRALLTESNQILQELRPKLERATSDILYVQHYSNRAEILQSDDLPTLSSLIEDKVQSIISKNAPTQAQLAAHILPRNISANSVRVSTIVARKADNLMDDGAPKSFNVCTVEKFTEGRIISEFRVDPDEIKKLEKIASGNSLFASNEKKIRAQKEMLKIAITIIENIRAINPDLKVAMRIEGDFPRGLVNAMMYYCEVQKSKGELGYGYLNLTQHQFAIKQPGLDAAEEHIAQVQAQIFRDKAGKEGLISRTEEATLKSDMNLEEHPNKRPRF